MLAIIIVLAAVLINAFLPFADTLMNDLFNVVFHAQNLLPGSFSTIVYSLTTLFYQIGVSLLVLKFLKKMFDIYVLGTDGDPDTEPTVYVINFAKAMVTAICFPYIFNLFVSIADEILDSAMASMTIGTDLMSQWGTAAWQSLGIVTTLFGLVFLICVFILYFKFLQRGLELTFMIIGMPLACSGLLENDRGIFKPYFTQFVKIIITTVFQIILCRLGLALALSVDVMTLNFDVLFWAIACEMLAMKVPQVLAEFMIPSQGGGGIMQKIYSVSMMTNMVKGFIKK